VIQWLRLPGAVDRLGQGVTDVWYDLNELRLDLALSVQTLLMAAGKVNPAEAQDWVDKNLKTKCSQSPKPRRGAGSADYYLSLAQDDYYAAGSESPGYWQGKGARQLGLAGTVQREAFKHLLAGMSPDGSRPLVQNAHEEDRQCAWDLT